MNYIKSFETFLMESQYDDGLAGSAIAAIGHLQGRLVVSGNSVEKNQEKILAGIRKADRTARVDYYPKTQKVVGVVTVNLLKDIQKELRRIDGNLKAEIKK